MKNRHNEALLLNYYDFLNNLLMDGTIGKISNSFGLCISIKGPGITNMVPGISLCHFENFPIISFFESQK